MANDVTARHPDYEAALPDWTLVSDVVAGDRQVKSKGDAYLPRPNKSDKSAANRDRYEQYLARAAFYPATGRTLRGLVGIAFRKWPEVELPNAMGTFESDVTGAGVPLIQHSQGTLTEIVKTGRGGLLADYPQVVGPVSRADQESGGVQPTLSFYPATAITNWRTIKRGSKLLLSLVVLKETHEIEDGFALKHETQFRVLKLISGFYQQEIHRKVKAADGQEEWRAIPELTAQPKQGNGRPWEEIPFQFVGSEKNDTEVDQAPLLGIATVNKHHFMNSADYEDSVYMNGQMQTWMSGLDQQWVDMLEEKGIYVGSRSILPLPVGGSCGMLQPDPNTLARGAMDQKEAQMTALGARLLTRGSANASTKTATEVDSDDATAHSVLSLCCDNVSKAYEQVLKWASNFANATGDVVFSIPTEFTKIVDAATLQVMLQLVQAGKMPEADLFTALRIAGYVDSEKDDEQIREEIAAQPPPANGGLEDDDEGGEGNSAAAA